MLSSLAARVRRGETTDHSDSSLCVDSAAACPHSAALASANLPWAFCHRLPALGPDAATEALGAEVVRVCPRDHSGRRRRRLLHGPSAVVPFVRTVDQRTCAGGPPAEPWGRGAAIAGRAGLSPCSMRGARARCASRPRCRRQPRRRGAAAGASCNVTWSS